MDRFRGRTAIVTGASRGIGAAIAERLAAEGADLLLVARTLDQHEHLAGSLNETVARCRTYGTRVEAMVADLGDAASRAAIVPAALDMFGGRVDILVNNAAAAMYASMLTYPAKRRMITFEVNVFAPMDLSQAVIPSMIEHGEGWIVNVSSGSARHVAIPPKITSPVSTRLGIYGASKAALNRITNAFAVELDGTGVRINTVEPRGAVASEGAEAVTGGALDRSVYESMEEMVEGALVLCDCDTDMSGGVHVTLDLINQLGLTIHGLNAQPLTP